MTMKQNIQTTILILLISFISVSIQAQVHLNLPAAAERFATTATEYQMPETENEGETQSDSRNTIWQNNFDDASEWTPGGPTGFSTLFGFSVVNTGISWNFSGPFNSESGGNYARFQNGISNVTPPTVLNAGGFTLTCNTPININNAQTVLEFNQFGARFFETQSVQISIDNGNTWITVGNNDDIPRLTSSSGSDFPNPMKRKYNLFPYTNGSNVTSILLRLFWDGQLNGQNISYLNYGWVIDDLKIVDAASNDIQFNNLLVDFFFKNSGYYTRIPFSQQSEIEFRGAVFNNGTDAQTNVKMNVVVTRAGTELYNDESNIVASLGSFLVDTLTSTTPFLSSGNGTYTITSTVSQEQTDDFIIDNSLPVRTFIVNDTVFARDNGNINSSRISLIDFVGAEGPGSRLGSVFEFTKPGEIKSLSVYVASNSISEGASFKAVLYRLGSQFELVLESDIYDIAGAPSMGRWVTLQFNTDGAGEIVPDEGAEYFAGIEIVNGSLINNVFIASESVTPQPIRTTFIFVAGGANTGWFFISGGAQPLIRLNVKKQLVSIAKADVGLSSVNLMPNPSVDQTTLVYELSKASKINITITDIVGQMVFQNQLGFQNVGSHQYNISTENLSSGIYHVTIQTLDGKMTQKLMVR